MNYLDLLLLLCAYTLDFSFTVSVDFIGFINMCKDIRRWSSILI